MALEGPVIPRGGAGELSEIGGEMKLIEGIIKVMGDAHRGPEDLFSNRTFMKKFQKGIHSMVETEKSQYEMYKSIFEQVLNRLKQGKLSDVDYPYATKQQPKDVILRGEDGNFYQYLVKGHEDLRLDERIMQFFRLINTFLRKDSSFGGANIGTIAVIPLSTKHGLVSWVRGTDTLRVLVETYRKLYDRDPMEEFSIIENNFPSYDYFTNIQKTEKLEEIFEATPATDIANFFKLKADNAETWLKQTHTFTISTAMTSIVGYV